MNILNENKGEEIVVLGLYPNGQEFYFEVKVD
jgi:serine protease Do